MVISSQFHLSLFFLIAQSDDRHSPHQLILPPQLLLKQALRLLIIPDLLLMLRLSPPPRLLDQSIQVLDLPHLRHQNLMLRFDHFIKDGSRMRLCYRTNALALH